MRLRIVPILLLAAALLSGCNILGPLLYLVAPRRSETIAAEFDDLAGKTVAIVIYADMDTLYEYPYTRTEMAMAVGTQLRDNIADVRIVHPSRVIRYQEGNLHWDTEPMGEIGRALDADYVLYVSLNEFTTHEPGSVNLPVGRVSASVSLWDTSVPTSDPGACVWHKDNLAVKIDANAGPLAWDPEALRLQMQRVFADRLAKHFYEHTVVLDETAPADPT